MADLIDRQNAIDAIVGILTSGQALEAERRINRLPSAQPEIVLCKECKHSRFFDPCFYCYEFGGEIIVPENGFCFMAKRRTDE